MGAHNEGRIKWIDIAKAIIMVLVVFGHTMRGGAGQRIVYSFHVAAFYFLAGMTCKTDRIGQRIKADFLRIMVPYYCFGLISIAIYAVLGRFAAAKFGMDINTSLTGNLLGLLYASAKGGYLQFNTPLWFLPCLFVTKLLYYAADRLCRGKAGPILAVSVILAAVSFGYTALGLPNPPFSFTVALKMLPFFALGRVFLQYIRTKSFPRPAAAFAGIALLAATCIIGYFAPKVNYSGDKFPNILAFLVTAGCGSVGVCLLSMGIARNRWLEYVGRDTLAILVMHKFPVLLFQTVGPFEELLAQEDSILGNLCGGAPAAILSIAMSLVAAIVVKKLFPFALGISKRNHKAGKHV